MISLVLTLLGSVIGGIVGLIAIAWSVGALFFDLPAPRVARKIAAIIWSLGAIILLLTLPFFVGLLAVAMTFLLILGWWLTLRPSLERDWKPQFAVLPQAVRQSEVVTIEHVRNFDYRTEIDFTERYETRSYDLRQLRGLDLFLTYWTSRWMAHPILSFDFGEGSHLCFSIETRQQRDEGYSAIKGFYRQFELTYLAADERDVVRLRTSIRQGHDVYLYRLITPPDQPRAYFLDFVRRLNELHARPEWYHALTSNCTTNIRTQRLATDRFPWDWRLLVNGYTDELLYERGALDRSLPFAELKRRAYINHRAREAGDAQDFSARIRA